VTALEDVREIVLATADLVDRAGARGFEIGYLNDEDDPQFAKHGAQWWAHARYRGTRIIVEGFDRPDQAADALSRRLLTGAKCRCGKLVTLGRDGAIAFDGVRMAAGQCLWTRVGARWNPSCDVPPVRVPGPRW
jgi:hypothetical protein